MTQTITLGVAEYAPDQPDGADASAMIRNVYPRTSSSYGPINAPAAQYSPLAARCQGATAHRDDTGEVYVLAGTATDLYMIKRAQADWVNVSKTDGGYNLFLDDVWNFTYFNGRVIAVNVHDDTQSYTLGVSTDFTDLAGSPPRARYIAVVKNNFVVMANTWDSENLYRRQRVWWSGAGDATSWPLLGTNAAAQVMSGATDLLGPGGAVQGIVAGLNNADAVVWQEHTVRTMNWEGPPTVFSFRAVESARGCLCPNSIVANGGVAYYWGQDGICAFDGGESRSIGAGKVDKTVYGDLNNNYLDRVVGASDPTNKLVWWSYPSTNSFDGNPDRMLIYSWELDRFSLAEITSETVLKLLSVGYTLDELWTVLGYTLDNVPAPLDSPVWTGGRPTLATFGADHRLAFATGLPLAATVDTAEQSVPGRVGLITNSRPLVDGINVIPSVALGRRQTLQDAVTYATPVARNSMGQCPVRGSGRYLRSRITIPANARWEHIAGVELDVTQQGRR